MCTRRLRLPLLVAFGACALAGCGGGGSTSSLGIGQLPLVPGAAVIEQARQCDRGANAYCAVEAVIVDRRFPSSGAFVSAEHRQLRSLGWSGMAGDDGNERAAESPGRKVRVTYATGSGDLVAWDEGWIKRPRPIALTLSRLMFDRAPVMSVMLEVGSG